VKTRYLYLGIILTYLLSHLWNLSVFPVFSDEAIYIRWSQLILDDWKQYLFFAMNDGKTPLFIWLLTPLQLFFSNQLVAGRILSVAVGLAQVLVMGQLVKQLGGRRQTQFLAMLFSTLLPFWFFSHRVALMDGLLTLFLSLAFWSGLRLVQGSQKNLRHAAPLITLTGIFTGLAVWSKLPAIFFVGALPLLSSLPAQLSREERVRRFLYLGVAAGIGIFMLLLLRVSPAFGQLFSRSQDFTYSLSEIMVEGKWTQTLPSFPTYFAYFGQYLTWPVVVLSLAGLFMDTTRRKVAILLLFAVAFCLPITLLGKVVYPRYLLPGAIFFTLASVLTLQAMHDQIFVLKKAKSMLYQVMIALLFAAILGNIFTASASFTAAFTFAPNATPFVSADRQQYLEEWSSGHGISEVAAMIKEAAKTRKIAVATEGRFGTLPDGLLLFFHRTNTENIYIEGTGQYPVKTLPEFFVQRAKLANQSWLIVNSHRMELPLDESKLIREFCRPNNAPCLQVWDVTDEVKKAP